MKSYQASDARLKMREILTAAEHGEHVQIKRYETVTAVVVSPEWYEQAAAALEGQWREALGAVIGPLPAVSPETRNEDTKESKS